jgi:hypothetical protein
MAKKLIMSWSKCKIEVGKTEASDAMAAELFHLVSSRTKVLP